MTSGNRDSSACTVRRSARSPCRAQCAPAGCRAPGRRPDSRARGFPPLGAGTCADPACRRSAARPGRRPSRLRLPFPGVGCHRGASRLPRRARRRGRPLLFLRPHERGWWQGNETGRRGSRQGGGGGDRRHGARPGDRSAREGRRADRSAVALAVPASRPLRTRNVILVTVDGLRIQELFAGMDAIVSRNPKRSGIYDLERRAGDTGAIRPRSAARRSCLISGGGWRRRGSSWATSGREQRAPEKSTPVLRPRLCGDPDGAIPDRCRQQRCAALSPPTVLEFVRRELGLGKRQVATFGSWEGFATLSRARRGRFHQRRLQRVPPEIATPRMASLNELQFEIMGAWRRGGATP